MLELYLAPLIQVSPIALIQPVIFPKSGAIAGYQTPHLPSQQSAIVAGLSTNSIPSSIHVSDLPQTVPPIPPGSLEPERPDVRPLPETQPTPLVPVLPEPSSTPAPEPSTPELTVLIQKINVLGSTVFSDEEIQHVTQRFIGKQATFEDLLAIRAAITDLYTRNGYTTSGAFLPPQDVTRGVITVQVVEGELERIEIEGLHHLRNSYVRDRIQLAAGPPVNIQQLEQALQLLQLNPLFTSIQAELTPGTTAGRSILQLTLQEALPFNATLGVDNYNSPSTGSLRGIAALEYTDLLGLGDRISAEYDITEGVDSYSVGYAIPLNAYDGTLSLNYGLGNSSIIEAPFDTFDVRSNSETVSLAYRQPLVRSPTSELALGLAVDLRRSQTFLFDDKPFSFSEGPEDGKSRVTVLRFSQDWLNRSSSRVLAARSQFSIGLDAFDATVNDTGTDARFVSWVGQFQWVQELTQNIISVVRLGAQLTPDSLLPLEQFSIGGVNTVRGYRQDQLVADNGIVGSVEVRVPVVRDFKGIGVIQLVPFFDIGTVWNNREEAASSNSNTLASVGLGLRWDLNSNIEARLDYGIPLIDVNQESNSLQDDGLFFSFTVRPF
ncbi:MAG TPA: ShlB/FhaC/HecB family hemolysin secretion/activation protein [Crinalium sp.]